MLKRFPQILKFLPNKPKFTPTIEEETDGISFKNPSGLTYRYFSQIRNSEYLAVRALSKGNIEEPVSMGHALGGLRVSLDM